ncbi:MAG: anion transporter [Deinococcus sp.]|nr:anion transporter [Deinococcus sp.]
MPSAWTADVREIVNGLIVALTYLGVAIGYFPGFRLNRQTIALVGAALVVATGIVRLGDAYAAIDHDTILLLFSMMILNANLQLAGFFRLVGRAVVQRARSPLALLALLVFASGILSALFLNDTVVLMLTPLVVEVTLNLQRNPIPYLLALATSANIGSSATIAGNPQNILIGAASGISYLRFVTALGPTALLGLVACIAIIALVYRQEFIGVRFERVPLSEFRPYRPLLNKALLCAAGVLLLFLIGYPVAGAAFFGAAALLITRRIKPEKVFAEINWGLLVFFSGLFVVTSSLEHTGLSQHLFQLVNPLVAAGVGPLSVVSVILSNLISNVPAVLLFRPIVPNLANPELAWLTLAMSSTLAGNLTLLGSVANLIVAEEAARKGVDLTFGAYLKVGVPVTLVTTAIGVILLGLRR